MFTKRCIRGRTDNGGYYTLEAAVFLPLFIIAVLTVGYIVKVICIGENVMYDAMDEAAKVSAEAIQLKNGLTMKGQIKERISRDNQGVSEIKVGGIRYLYRDTENDGLISFVVNCSVDIKLPIKLYDHVKLTDRLLFRGLIGTKGRWDAMGFGDMEKDKEADIVWVFPDSGIRYHKESCTYVTGKPSKLILTEKIRKQYAPCHLCHPEKMPEGSTVYCFLKAGESYHMAGCKTIDRHTVTMDEKEAVEKGYTPCSKCGGN